MTATIHALVERHLGAWNAQAQPERRSAYESTYARDVMIGEPDARLSGYDGMDHAIVALQAAMPGMTLALDGAIQTTQDMMTYRWTLGPPHGEAVVGGRDVITVADDRIASVHVFIDAGA